jgi:hypothetical protein
LYETGGLCSWLHVLSSFRRRRMWTSGEDYLWNASAAYIIFG